MDLKQFHTLYNFRQRTEEELSVMKDQLETRSRSRSSSSTSSSSSSSSSSTYSSSSSTSSSRSLPYSISSRGNLSSEDDNTDVIDAMLEERLRYCRKRRRSSGTSCHDHYRKQQRDDKRTKYFSSGSSLSRSRSPSPAFKFKRTVLISGLSPKANAKDVQDFFSQAGKIKRTRLGFNATTLEFENSAFVEYENAECVLLALALNGKKYKGSPIVVQPSHREDQVFLNNKERRPAPVQVEIRGFPKDMMQKDHLESHFSKIIRLDVEARVAKVNFDNTQEAFTLCHELRLLLSTTLSFSVKKQAP